MPSICQGTWDCQICPKAVSNAITHVIYQRGFHKPAQKCEENRGTCKNLCLAKYL